jgi:serine/threonine-protein kinase
LILVGAMLVAGLIVFGLLKLTAPKDAEAKGTIGVPNVVELGQAAAVNLLTEYELVAEPRFEASEDVPKGLVIRSDPSVNVIVDKGSTVVIWVSTGADEATVPKVNGLMQADAEAAIERAGLVVKEILEDNSDPTVGAGRATRTDPIEGTVVSPDEPITLYISTGKIQLPDVTNKSIEEATAILAALGLAVEVIEQQTDAKPSGTVLSQNPQPGLQNQGTGVQLTVATAVVYHAVPGLVGKDEDTATAAVKALNFVAGVTRQNSLTVPEGTVISQSPAKDTQLAEGQTVSFVVSLGPPIIPTPTPTP